MNEYYYILQPSQDLAFSTKADNIIQADTIAVTNGVDLKKVSVGIGGRLIILDLDTARTALLAPVRVIHITRDGVKKPIRLEAELKTLPPKEVCNTIPAPSLNEALRINKRVLDKYRYSPNHAIFWQICNGARFRVTDFEPDKKQVTP